MNLFSARLTAADGGLNLHLGEQSWLLALSAPTVERWRAWLDQPLTAGIRPEHLHLVAAEAGGLRATVADAEYLGHETLLHMRIDGMAASEPTLVARLSGIQLFVRHSTVREGRDGSAVPGLDPAASVRPRRSGVDRRNRRRRCYPLTLKPRAPAL